MHLGNPSQEADDEEANDMEENDEEEEDKEEDGMRRLGWLATPNNQKPLTERKQCGPQHLKQTCV